LLPVPTLEQAISAERVLPFASRAGFAGVNTAVNSSRLWFSLRRVNGWSEVSHVLDCLLVLL
jgi:hypothetical protein